MCGRGAALQERSGAAAEERRKLRWCSRGALERRQRSGVAARSGAETTVVQPPRRVGAATERRYRSGATGATVVQPPRRVGALRYRSGATGAAPATACRSSNGAAVEERRYIVCGRGAPERWELVQVRCGVAEVSRW